MKRTVWGVLLAAGMVATLSGCDLGSVKAQLVPTSVQDARAQLATQRSPRVDDSSLVSPGTLTVGLSSSTSTAPLVMRNAADEVFGVDVDLAAALAQELGLKVSYVGVSDPSASLGTSCDIVLGVRSSARGSSYAVSGDYAQSAAAFFRKGEAAQATVPDLSGKRVGLQTGSMSETTLRNTGLSMEVQGYPNLNEAFDALAAGQVDYVLCDAYSGAFLSRSHKGVSFAGTLDIPVTVGFACSASNATLQSAVSDALAAIQANGVYDIIRLAWVGGLPQLGPSSQIKNIPAPSSTAQENPASAQGTFVEGAPAAGSNAVNF